MVEWLAGNRIIGTTAERPSASLQSPSVGGWVEVGRTTLGSAGDTISVASLADKRYYMFLGNHLPSGNFRTTYRLNNDSGSNYALRKSEDGGSENVTTSITDITSGNEDTNTQYFDVSYLSNLSAKEKLMINHNMRSGGTGAGNAPKRVEAVSKWANTSSVINRIDAVNDQGGDYASGSEVVVLGFDPTDTHTTNFWEQLASVTLGTDGDVLSSGTFTAKKYLWVQAFIKNSGTSARYNTEMTFNGDTGSNYSERRSLDGSSDATSVNQTKIMNSGVTGSNDDLWCLNMFIINNSANEKLCIGHGFDTYAGSGAGTAPSQRFEKVAKWANTSSQITNITITNSDTSNYDAISELRVWGSD